MKKGLSFIMLFTAIFAIIFVFNRHFILIDYYADDLKVSMEISTTEDDMFQLFYREATGKFNEENSIRVQVEGKEGIQKLHFIIPDSIMVTHFRFDFGNNHHISPVKINEVLLSYKGNRKSIAAADLEKYFIPNRYAESSEDGYKRKIIGERSDPFFTSVDMQNEIAILSNKPNQTPLVINFILTVLLASCMVLAIMYHIPEISFETVLTTTFILTFILMLLIPHLDELGNLDDTSITEKRVMAELPALSVASINEYPEAFEAYYNDNFGFRKKMVSLGAIFKVKVFNTSPDLEKAIVGKNDWLFYWRDDIRSSYLRENPFPEGKLGSLGRKITTVYADARKEGRIFLGTIFPNKHTVYEELIPIRFKNLQRNADRRIDQFYEYLKKRGIPSIPQEADIIGHKGNRLLYRKYDTHWNSLGAYYAYENIIRTIGNLNDSISEPLEMTDFEITKRKNFKHGDLLDLLGIDNRSGVFQDELFNFNPSVEKEFKETQDFYGPGTVLIENENAGNSMVLLYFADSYSDELIKFLPLHFGKTILVRNIHMDQTLIDKIDPQFILYGIVERNLENFR